MTAEKTILIVEDNYDSRQIYGEILRDENFTVIETEHGTEALEFLKNHAIIPDLIIMDLTFPLMSAKEFVDRLNADSKWQRIPLLVVSGQVDTQETSHELNAKGFLRKPFALDPFLETIKKLAH